MAFLHRNKRKVDLGGASKRTTDKQKLIEQTEKEREKRSENRVLNEKALRIQVLYNHLFIFSVLCFFSLNNF